jgi:hypothetical protein
VKIQFSLSVGPITASLSEKIDSHVPRSTITVGFVKSGSDEAGGEDQICSSGGCICVYLIVFNNLLLHPY